MTRGSAYTWGCRSLVLLLGALCLQGCEKKPGTPSAPDPQSPTTNPAIIAAIESMVRPPASIQRKDGIALAILLDTSGSMAERVPDADGSRKVKIDVARRCIGAVVRQAEGFVKEQPGQPLLVGIYEFSGRSRGSTVRLVQQLSAPSASAADNALSRLNPEGDTPIGEAIIKAKQDLDAAGLSRMHILIVTDGANTRGYTPADAVAAIGRLPLEDRAGIYFIAFDVADSVFAAAKEAGALVLPASNAAELQRALDELVGNKILLEK